VRNNSSSFHPVARLCTAQLPQSNSLMKVVVEQHSAFYINLQDSPSPFLILMGSDH
jgi:hypothetical protein